MTVSLYLSPDAGNLNEQQARAAKHAGDNVPIIFTEKARGDGRPPTSWALTRQRRPALHRALEQLKAGDRLLISRPDAISTEPAAVATIVTAVHNKGGAVVFFDAQDPVVDGLVAFFDTHQRMLHSFHGRPGVRTSGTTRPPVLAKEGRIYHIGGKPPFGWQAVKDKDGWYLEPHPEEAEPMRLMVSLREEGKSYRAIAAELHKQGVKSPLGRDKWSPRSVMANLKRHAEITEARKMGATKEK